MPPAYLPAVEENKQSASNGNASPPAEKNVKPKIEIVDGRIVR